MPPKMRTRPAITIPAIAPPFNAGAAAAADAAAAATGGAEGAAVVGRPLVGTAVPATVGAEVTGFFVGWDVGLHGTAKDVKDAKSRQIKTNTYTSPRRGTGGGTRRWLDSCWRVCWLE